ncbi:hypothetical protein DFP72DRAFT_1061310 [Ephemerocybe angulata]|uniref:Uncharacterized protein n=1 Tax=Ephemerocybe angulata TaxID=980116 RepID=A0A8H6IAN7_9AGAR|nr:hypothetical protein DFP72DRAFT_1061310 [Tulosesus angulatus]
MTYENFVHDLDAGDSFTATMVDILVKEYAERRTRPHSDRRFLSARTMKGLRQLAMPLNQFHMGPVRTGPRAHASFRRTLNSIVPEFDEDDDNDFGVMIDEPTEGGMAPGPANLADAMSIPAPWYNGMNRSMDDLVASSRSRVRSPPGAVSSNPTPVAGSSSAVPWTVLPSPSPATVTRQASIRRPFTNARNIEFNNFTRRHRSSHREGGEGDGDVTVTEPRDDPWTTRATSMSNSTTATRRFFPVAARRLRRSSEQRGGMPRMSTLSDGTSSDEDFLWTSPGMQAGTPEGFLAYIRNPMSQGGSRSGTGAATTGSSSSTPSTSTLPPFVAPGNPGSSRLGTTVEDDGAPSVTVAAPRLRRGGVRAPESIVSPPPVEEAAPQNGFVGNSLVVGREGATNLDLLEEPAAYPTPGSIGEGEHLT